MLNLSARGLGRTFRVASSNLAVSNFSEPSGTIGRLGRGLLQSVLIGLLLSAAPAAFAENVWPPRGKAGPNSFSPTVVPGEVIVRYRKGAPSAARAAALGVARAAVNRRLRIPDSELLRVARGKERETAARLARDPNVLYAEPNLIVYAHATPNDTRFTDLWALHNTGQTVDGVTGTADADIDATEAWELVRGLGGSPVRVAVIDTGIALDHPDLAGAIFTNPGESGGGKETNEIDDDGNGFIDDVHGWDFVQSDNDPTDDNEHGSHVAGTIAAISNNALGIAGVAGFPTTSGAWLGPKVIPIKVLNAFGSGSTSDIGEGIVYAGTMGAKVANMSLGGGVPSAFFDDAMRTNPNTLYVVSAGNAGANNDTTPTRLCVPATLPDVPNKLCVAASDQNDALASFSNFGPVNVDLAAPGVDTLSAGIRKTLLSDNLETPIAGRWTTNDPGQSGPPWDRSTLFATSPTNSIADSPGGTPGAPDPYSVNQNNWARNTAGLAFAGRNCQLFFQTRIDTESGFDFFTVDMTTMPAVATSWLNRFNFTGLGQGFVQFATGFEGRTNVFIRFRMLSDSTIVDDGVYVDDVRVSCIPRTYNAASYAFFNGTSMAAPHVAGAAAFLFTKFPSSTVAQVIDKILRSVDVKPALTGLVATNGRLNLYKAGAQSTAAVAGGVLTFSAGSGQGNRVTVTRFTDTDSVAKYRIRDAYSTTGVQTGSRIVPGAGCTSIDDNTVKCPIAGITRIVVNGANLNDTLNAATITIPVTLNGGQGMDTLTGGTAGDMLIGGSEPDSFTGGAGSDTISARNDDADTLFACGESAGDNDTVNADLSPDDPVTASATNCETVNKL